MSEEREFVIRFKKPRFMDKLKQQWDENPTMVVAVGAGAVTALAKLIEATAGIQSRRAYAKQVNNRAKKKQGEQQ